MDLSVLAASAHADRCVQAYLLKELPAGLTVAIQAHDHLLPGTQHHILCQGQVTYQLWQHRAEGSHRDGGKQWTALEAHVRGKR